MGAMKDLIAIGLVILLGLAGAAYFLPKGSTKLLNQNILLTNNFVNNLRDIATDYASLNPSQDFQGINMAELKDKNLLPTNADIQGSGDSSYIVPPYDYKTKIYVIDPNSGDATLKGRQYKITIDATGSDKIKATDRQIWEDKLKSNFERDGGVVSDYQSSNADGKISVTFE